MAKTRSGFNKGGGSAEYRDIMSRLPDTPRPVDYDEMPKLRGTEKQVKWANKIREEIVDDLTTYVSYYTPEGNPSGRAGILAKGKKAMAQDIMQSPLVTSTSGKLRQQKIDSAISSYVDTANRWNRVLQLVDSHTDASFWIDNRANETRNYMNKKLRKYVDGK